MRWLSHIAIAGAITAVFNPLAVPAAIAGSTAPDWLEFALRPLAGRKIQHRGVTHYLVYWIAAMLFAHFVFDWQGMLFYFAFGGFVHWFCDALTITGAPVSPWSTRKTQLFGGRLRTGSPAEYVIAFVIVFICGVVIYTKTRSDGYIPFFTNWPGLYQDGTIDAVEWRRERFSWF
jgi:inner membrane protein